MFGETAKVSAKNDIYWTYEYPIDQFYGVIYVPVADMNGQPFEEEISSRLLTRWLNYEPPILIKDKLNFIQKIIKYFKK